MFNALFQFSPALSRLFPIYFMGFLLFQATVSRAATVIPAAAPDHEINSLAAGVFGPNIEPTVFLADASGIWLGATSSGLELNRLMTKGETVPTYLVIWGLPSNDVFEVTQQALQFHSFDGRPLDQLHFLYLGKESVAKLLRPRLEAAGAKFYFRPFRP